LEIHAQIQKEFQGERDCLPGYTDRLAELDKSLEKQLKPRTRDALESARRELSERVEEIELGARPDMYEAETAELLSEYTRILKTPIRVSFMGRNKRDDSGKARIVAEYLRIAQRYANTPIEVGPRSSRMVCSKCAGTKFDVTDGSTYTCQECFTQEIVFSQVSSHSDIGRVDLSGRYMYERHVHFRDCIAQFQAKQNSSVHHDVYKNLEDWLDLHHQLVGDASTPKQVRFAKVTKYRLHKALGELGYNAHYENLHLIHHVLTGVPANDITHLEDRLLENFHSFVDKFDEIFPDLPRKSFLSSHWLLYVFLLRLKYKCREDDFKILKTLDRKKFHNQTTKAVFAELGWTHPNVL
jgi:hypothetical protein